MKRTARSISILAAVAAAVLIFSWSPRTAAAPSPVQDTQQGGAPAAPPAGSSSPMNMMGMMRMHDGMMASMKADDDKVKTLVDKMNKATGDTKIAAMAELLTTLAEQRTAEHASMMQMQGQMMSQMMGRMMNPPAPAPAK